MKPPTNKHVHVLTSRQNPLAQQARAVRAGKQPDLIFIEGLRLSEEAVAAALQVETALFTERITREARGRELLSNLQSTGARLSEVSESVLASVADTDTPQGLIMLARRPRADRNRLDDVRTDVPLLVIIHGVSNPANAGAMLRVAEAAGATGVIATDGTVNLFAPKSLRGAMGSAFRLPIWMGASFTEALAWCTTRGIDTVATDLHAAHKHTDVNWMGPHALIMGAEARGLTRQESAAATARLRIPMQPPVESLNVATALAIVLYEAARQREGKRQK
ncbi:MAG: TrmH family RNA methyltransferase [Pyrinomonadaceae bacterium]